MHRLPAAISPSEFPHRDNCSAGTPTLTAKQRPDSVSPNCLMTRPAFRRYTQMPVRAGLAAGAVDSCKIEETQHAAVH